MRLRLAALAIVAYAAACFVYTDRSPPPPRESPRESTNDPAAPDPLPLWLIARLQHVNPAGARNLFDFGAPPAPPNPRRTRASDPAPNAADVATSIRAATVKERSPSLTFYGYVSGHSHPLRAFFSDGDEIYIKSEGDLIAGRYRVLHIDAAAAVLYDTSANRQHTLTLDAS